MEYRIEKLGVSQIGSLQLRPSQIRLLKACLNEMGASDLGLDQL